MDSSRSGLLSTILMTLPLIVVPAVALLRPPGQAGISTADLGASEDNAELEDSFFDEIDRFETDDSGAFKKQHLENHKRSGNAVSNDSRDRHSKDDRHADAEHRSNSKPEDDIFDELKSYEFDESNVSPKGSSSRGTPVDPFMDASVPGSVTPGKLRGSGRDLPEKQPAEPELDSVKPAAGEIVEQLNSLGALKTIWFEAGETAPLGLAVFFRGSQANTRIRFEAVGPNREACAKDVLGQVMRWQQQNPEQ